jgi:hypothetical protein
MDRPPATPLEWAACRTYRYLRLTIVGLVVLLAVSVILETVRCGRPLDSISASYYTPARNVFVGALIGIGAALISIRGRPGPENGLLNIAGMAASMVALVPTPPRLSGDTCSAAPAAVGASVQNNIWALLAAGLFGLIAAAVSTAYRPRHGWRTLAAAGVLWATVLVWFGLWRESFVSTAHYAASALLFVMLTAIAVINAVHARYHPDPPLLPAAAYRAIYWSVAAVMALTMIAAGVLWFAHLAPADMPGGWMLWVETVLVAAFGLYWLAQTAQFWRTGVPRPA